MRILFIFFIVVVALSMGSCSKTNNEERIIRKTTSSLQYKSYYTLTKSALPILHSQMKHDKSFDTITVNDLRIYLAYSWATSQKNTFGYAETSLILEDSGSTETQKQMAHLINSMLLINLNCITMSEKEFALSNPILSTSTESTKDNRILLHLIIGIACVYNEQYEHARYHFSILSKISPYSWPYKLTDAILLIKQGKIQRGLIELKRLQDDLSVPKDMRDIIHTQITSLEKNTGPVESDFFWLRAMGYIVFDELKRTASPSIVSIINTIEKFKKSLPFSL